MFKLSSAETQFLWDKQLSVLTFRTPGWILSSMFGALVIIAIEILMIIPRSERLAAILYTDTIAYGVYATFSICIYVYLLTSFRRKNSKTNPYLVVWLYGVYDISSLTLLSLLILGTGFIALETTGLPGNILQAGKIILLLSYAILALTTIILTPHSIRQQIATDRPVTAPVLKLAMAIPSFLVGMGVMIGQFFFQTGQFKIGFMLVGGIFIITSFILMSLSLSGIYRFISMALQGFNDHKAMP